MSYGGPEDSSEINGDANHGATSLYPGDYHLVRGAHNQMVFANFIACNPLAAND
jgi:hypothetical protein